MRIRGFHQKMPASEAKYYAWGRSRINRASLLGPTTAE